MNASATIRKPRASFDSHWNNGVMVIIDLCDGKRPSVSNDAEAVVAHILSRIKYWKPPIDRRNANSVCRNLRIIYRDTDGRFDELVHDGNQFISFRLLGARNEAEAVSTICAEESIANDENFSEENLETKVAVSSDFEEFIAENGWLCVRVKNWPQVSPWSPVVHSVGVEDFRIERLSPHLFYIHYVRNSQKFLHSMMRVENTLTIGPPVSCDGKNAKR